ncbi:hypothetical protein M0R45_010704 [Rubus argutus]|uniref:Uncharacterized protein n=1 Tax=Rubus argutus TaxID=59490 RepID=A0AAW1YA68_RUBAR
MSTDLKKAKCYDCGATITRLIREYSVQVNNDDDKNYFIGRFPTATGLPKFSRMKKYSENESPLCNKEIQDGLQGDKPLVLENETGQSQYQGHLEQQSAVPAASWYAIC